ncbi:hypothetical protein M433DRAFT_494173 [Acidomyces richmondensis BFW]|nr:MAG: hypothetical protein FE78DRAFT_294263 [Acidomyces sp. 'richmondensis']KYG47478.1 hypothetical protein M433DRAFT_494173 [Acidomyces richmondensis BFW]
MNDPFASLHFDLCVLLVSWERPGWRRLRNIPRCKSLFHPIGLVPIVELAYVVRGIRPLNGLSDPSHGDFLQAFSKASANHPSSCRCKTRACAVPSHHRACL